MTKNYRGDLVKDHLGMAVMIGGLGAILMIVPLITLYVWVGEVTGNGTPLEDIILNVSFFLALFLIGGMACFYMVWRGSNEQVSVGDGKLVYRATFFTRKIPVMNIDKIMLFGKAGPVVIYDAGDEKKRIRLPWWKSNDYASDLVSDLKRLNPNISASDLRPGAAEEVAPAPAAADAET